MYYHTITTHFILPRDPSSTFVSTGPPIDALTNGEYPQLTIDMNTALHTIGIIRVSVWSDASGTIFVPDSNNNDINNRTLISTSYTYPFIDISGNIVEGTMTMTFDDNGTFTNDDTNNQAYWYAVMLADGIFTIYQFT
jgi:hypothetical protein